MGIYVKFTKTTHQIWSCHVTLASNFENFYFSPDSVLKFGKSYQIWGNLAEEQKSYRQKQIGGGKHPHPLPSAYRVKHLIRKPKVNTGKHRKLLETIITSLTERKFMII